MGEGKGGCTCVPLPPALSLFLYYRRRRRDGRERGPEVGARGRGTSPGVVAPARSGGGKAVARCSERPGRVAAGSRECDQEDRREERDRESGEGEERRDRGEERRGKSREIKGEDRKLVAEEGEGERGPGGVDRACAGRGGKERGLEKPGVFVRNPRQAASSSPCAVSVFVSPFSARSCSGKLPGRASRASRPTVPRPIRDSNGGDRSRGRRGPRSRAVEQRSTGAASLLKEIRAGARRRREGARGRGEGAAGGWRRCSSAPQHPSHREDGRPGVVTCNREPAPRTPHTDARSAPPRPLPAYPCPRARIRAPNGPPSIRPLCTCRCAYVPIGERSILPNGLPGIVVPFFN